MNEFIQISICNWNCGNTKNETNTKLTIETLKNLDIKPDIILFQELNLEDFNFPKDFEYTIFSNRKKHIFLKEKFFKNAVEQKFSFDIDISPCVYVQVQHTPSNQNLWIICCHVPRKERDEKYKTESLLHLKKILEQNETNIFTQKPDLIILGGDFNYPLTKTKNKIVVPFMKNPLWKHIPFLITDNKKPIDGIFCIFKGKSVQFETKTIEVDENYDHPIQNSQVKLPIKEDIIEKVEKIFKDLKIENKSNEDSELAVFVSGEYRHVEFGPKGGLFYYTPSGNKSYIRENSKIVYVNKSSIKRYQPKIKKDLEKKF